MLNSTVTTLWIVVQVTQVMRVTQEALTANLGARVTEARAASDESAAVRRVTVEIESDEESVSPVMYFCQEEPPKLFHR